MSEFIPTPVDQLAEDLQHQAKLNCESWINSSCPAQPNWPYSVPGHQVDKLQQALFAGCSLPSTPTYAPEFGLCQSNNNNSDMSLNYSSQWPQQQHQQCPQGWTVRNRSCTRSSISSTVSSELLSPTELGLPFESNGREAASADMFYPMPPVSDKPSGNAFTFPSVSGYGSGGGVGVGGGRPTTRLLPSQKLGLTPIKRTEKRREYNFCVFCKNNGEDEKYYMSHTLKDDHGMVRCPVLEAYVCPICGATGKVAHTIRYCPKNKDDKFHDQMAPITLLKELRSSTGKPRYSTADLEPLVEMCTPPPEAQPSSLRPPRPIYGQGYRKQQVPNVCPMPGDLLNHPGRYQ